jgi:hypothetical protein
MYATTSSEQHVSLLYLEAMLFPRLFPICKDGAPVGAMPLFMLYNVFSGVGSKKPLASTLDHLMVRARTSWSMIGKSQTYNLWNFSIKLNAFNNFVPSAIIMKRGIEPLDAFRQNDGVSLTRNDNTFFETDEMQTRKVQELCAQVKECGYWKYFLTVTCNHKWTPGVAAFIDKLRVHHYEDFSRAYITYLPIILRLWHRHCKYLKVLLHHGMEKLLGPVKEIFWRYEFQSGSGTGNLPHVHMLLMLEEEPLERTRKRVAARDMEMFKATQGKLGEEDFFMGTLERDALMYGLVDNEEQYDLLIDMWEYLFVSFSIFLVFHRL